MIEEVLRAHPEWTVTVSGFGTELHGPVRIKTGRGRIFTFDLEVVVPRNFPAPDAHPTAKIVKHGFGPNVNLGADAHVNADGTLCVQMPRRHEIPYETVGLMGFIQQVVVHLDRIRIYVFTGRFPGESYAHGPAGKREYEEESKELRAAFKRDVEAVCMQLPEGLRRFGNWRVPLLERRARCRCGSGRRFEDCHRDGVLKVRRETQALGPGPEVPKRRWSRNPFRAPRRH